MLTIKGALRQYWEGEWGLLGLQLRQHIRHNTVATYQEVNAEEVNTKVLVGRYGDSAVVLAQWQVGMGTFRFLDLSPIMQSYFISCISLKKDNLLRVLASCEAKTAKICNFWTFWPVIKLMTYQLNYRPECPELADV